MAYELHGRPIRTIAMRVNRWFGLRNDFRIAKTKGIMQSDGEKDSLKQQKFMSFMFKGKGNFQNQFQTRGILTKEKVVSENMWPIFLTPKTATQFHD